MATLQVHEQVNISQTPQLFQGKLAEFRASIARIPYGATVTNTVPKAAEVIQTWRVARKWVMDDRMVSNAVIDVAVGLLDDAALQALADLRTGFGKALAEYRAKLVDPSPDLAAPDAMRIWARVQRQLDGGVELSDIIDDETDLATLKVIGEEVKSYRRSKMAGDLKSADFIAEGDLAAVNARRYALATPAQRTNLDKAKESAKGEYNTNLSLGAAEHHVKHLNAAEPGNTIMPAWNGEIFRV